MEAVLAIVNESFDNILGPISEGSSLVVQDVDVLQRLGKMSVNLSKMALLVSW